MFLKEKKMLLQVLFSHKKATFAWGRQTDTPLTGRHTTFRMTEMKNSNRMKHRILCIALLLLRYPFVCTQLSLDVIQK